MWASIMVLFDSIEAVEIAGVAIGTLPKTKYYCDFGVRNSVGMQGSGIGHLDGGHLNVDQASCKAFQLRRSLRARPDSCDRLRFRWWRSRWYPAMSDQHPTASSPPSSTLPLCGLSQIQRSTRTSASEVMYRRC